MPFSLQVGDVLHNTVAKAMYTFCRWLWIFSYEGYFQYFYKHVNSKGFEGCNWWLCPRMIKQLWVRCATLASRNRDINVFFHEGLNGARFIRSLVKWEHYWWEHYCILIACEYLNEVIFWAINLLHLNTSLPFNVLSMFYLDCKKCRCFGNFSPGWE